jgi:hypothetical protein
MGEILNCDCEDGEMPCYDESQPCLLRQQYGRFLRSYPGMKQPDFSEPGLSSRLMNLCAASMPKWRNTSFSQQLLMGFKNKTHKDTGQGKI